MRGHGAVGAYVHFLQCHEIRLEGLDMGGKLIERCEFAESEVVGHHAQAERVGLCLDGGAGQQKKEAGHCQS